MHARLRAQDELRYRFAMERHDERVVKYEERVQRYEEECRQYPAMRARYVADSIAYLDQVAQAKAEFERTVAAEADTLHARAFRATSNRYNALMKDWRARCDAYMRSYADKLDSIGLAGNTEQVSRYVFAVNNLGWINCDRFYNVPPAEKRELIVQGLEQIRSEIRAAGPLGSASAVCTGWQGSPAHYANIIEPSFTSRGVGCWFCQTAEGQYTYWVVTFN